MPNDNPKSEATVYNVQIIVRLEHVSGQERSWDSVADALARSLVGETLQVERSKVKVTNTYIDTAD